MFPPSMMQQPCNLHQPQLQFTVVSLPIKPAAEDMGLLVLLVFVVICTTSKSIRQICSI
jgi:hypothetical protein